MIHQSCKSMVKTLSERVDKIEDEPLQYVKQQMDLIKSELKLQKKMNIENKSVIFTLTNEIRDLRRQLEAKENESITEILPTNASNNDITMTTTMKSVEVVKQSEEKIFLPSHSEEKTNVVDTDSNTSGVVSESKENVVAHCDQEKVLSECSIGVETDSNTSKVLTKSMGNLTDFNQGKFPPPCSTLEENANCSVSLQTKNTSPKQKKSTLPKKLGCNFCQRKFRVPSGVEKHTLQIHQMYQVQQIHYYRKEY